MKIGLLGGSFDPPHQGHLLLAETALEQCSLDQVWFVPCGRQPLKPQGPHLEPDQRLRAIEQLIKHNTKLKLSLLDWHLQRTCYTIDWLEPLVANHPQDCFYFILGMDSVRDLPRWREPKRIFELATPIIFHRPGVEIPEQMPYFSHPLITLPAVSSLSSTQLREQQQ